MRPTLASSSRRHGEDLLEGGDLGAADDPVGLGDLGPEDDDADGEGDLARGRALGLLRAGAPGQSGPRRRHIGKTIDRMAGDRPEQSPQRAAEGEAGGTAEKLSPDRHRRAP